MSFKVPQVIQIQAVPKKCKHCLSKGIEEVKDSYESTRKWKFFDI